MSDSSQSVEFHSQAFNKVILHAAKYPAKPIMGLLLASTSSSSSSSTLHIADVLPLFHTPALPAMLDVALTQAEIYATSQKLTLAGVYYSSDRFEAVHPAQGIYSALPNNHYSILTAEKIATNNNNKAKIVLLDNVALARIGSTSTESTTSPLESFDYRNSKWVSSGSVSVAALDSLVDKLRASISKENIERKLADFDDHLDDIKMDWTNAKLKI